MKKLLTYRRSLHSHGRLPKHQLYFNHLARRFLERFDIGLTIADVKYMIRQIREGTATLVKANQFRSRTMWRVRLREKEFTVVYDSRIKMLVTVNPKDEELEDPYANSNI